MLKVFTCTDHDHRYPVGVCSIVVASDEAEAREQLDIALVLNGLDPRRPYTLQEVKTTVRSAQVLLTGDY